MATISFADYYKISEDVYKVTGALDPILGVDTRLFIDPSLLRVAQTPELEHSYRAVGDYFEDVLKVVSNISAKGDRMWRQADELLKFPEVSGLCIGYASAGSKGSGMGAATRDHLLTTVWEVVKAGIKEPALFELVGIFEEGIGPDRISDMTAKIIAADLIRYTQRVCSDTGIPMEAHRLAFLRVEEDLPTNPLTKTPIILVPREILRDLPVATSYADLDWICSLNATLREEMNDTVAKAWKEATVAQQKEKVRKDIVRFPDVLAKMISEYLSEKPDRYDFESDPAGEVVWYPASKKLPEIAPLALALPVGATAKDVEGVVLQICEHFKSLVEDNGLSKLLYDKEGSPKHESAAQLLFFGVASAYCSANNLDLSPECDSGRGPVDFKMSKGGNSKCLVEIKLTTNKQLSHGFDKQLPIYQKAENTQFGIYLVIENGGMGDARRAQFWRKVTEAGTEAPRVIWVDATGKRSASKA